MPKFTEEEKKSLPLTPDVARLVRLYMERVAVKLEQQHSSYSYKSALRHAVRCIRALKPD